MKKKIIHIIANKPGRILIAFSLLFITAFLMTGLLEFEQDIFKVLPLHNRTFKVLTHSLKTSSAQNRLYLLVKGPEDPDALIASAEKLTDDLRNITINDRPALVQATFRKIDAVSIQDTEKLLIQYMHNPSLFITSKDLPRLEKLLTSEDAIEKELKRSLAYFAMPGAGQLARLAALDPLNMRQFMVEKLASLHGGLVFAGGLYLLSADRQSLLIMATPDEAFQNRTGAVTLLEKIDGIRTRYPRLEIGITGGYALAAQEESLIREDLLGCLVGSVLGISILFFLVYRNAMVLVFVLLPLGVGLQLALGTMALIFDKVHMLATAFATVILGLGIDFAIHVYDRYTSERQTGQNTIQAIEKSVFRTGSAVLAGGLTTLSAFLVLSFADSPILFQIGWLVALGLFFCLITILWVLPAWLVWMEQYSCRWLARPAGKLCMDRIGRIVDRHPGKVLAVSLVFFLAAGSGISRLDFEQDPMSLKPKELEAVQVQEDLLVSFDAEQEYVLIAWQAEDTTELWKKGKEIDENMETLQKRGIVSSWTSLSKFSSSHPLHIGPLDLELIGRIFQKYGLNLKDFKHQYRFLTALTGGSLGGGIYPEEIKENDCRRLVALPEMFQRFFFCENDGIQGITWAHVPGPEQAGMAGKIISDACTGCIVVSPRLVMNELAAETRRELWITVGSAGVLVIGILLFFFRSIPSILLVSLPMGMGLCATAGLMGWMGIELNLFNFIILPMLVGIGLDDGIHVLKRYRETGDVEHTLRSTGRSVLLTTLTTICGFGSLSLATYHVLKGMGLLAIFGVSACFIFTVTTLAPILKFRGHD